MFEKSEKENEKSLKSPSQSLIIFLFSIYFFSIVSDCQAKIQLDKEKYISVDEIKVGMDAYCLTVYEGTKIEKFKLEVLSVIRNIMPNRDIILVKGTDPRFIHTGPVAGCSGSPVYINGRMAGALSLGWPFSKDALYGVTPIGEMLEMDTSNRTEQLQAHIGYAFDYTKPLHFDQIYKQVTAGPMIANNSPAKSMFLPCPLIMSGVPFETCEQMSRFFEPFGFMAVAGISGGKDNQSNKEAKLVPGATIIVPLVSGDIRLTALGTVTEVVDDKVYAFGHGFLGYGAIDLPMGTGQVHTVVSSMFRSFKLGDMIDIVGALRSDGPVGIAGQIGAKANMIPLVIKVDHYNDSEEHLYNCQVVTNRLITPAVLKTSITGAILMLGSLPPDHLIEYKVDIELEDFEPISFSNVSSGTGIKDLLMESISTITLLMNNPYKRIGIKSMSFDIKLVPKNIISHIWSVDLSDYKVKAGESIDISIVLEAVLTGKKRYNYTLQIPEDLAPGRYNLIISGGFNYESFIRRTAPYKITPENIDTLLGAVQVILSIKRDKLYCTFVLPPGGVTVGNAELPDLPATKGLILQDSKRTLRTQPYQGWLEKRFDTGTIVIDKKTLSITVEKE